MLDELTQFLDGNLHSGNGFETVDILLALLLAYVLGQLTAWVYYATHTGLSYSRSFVQSLILITVVVSMVMFTIGNSLVTAVGLMGALAIIRFRNIIKDSRDIAFIFIALVIGMATGAQRFSIAIIGTLLLVLIVLYLHWTGFGTHQPHNGFLRFTLKEAMGPNHPVPAILKRFCNSFTLISMQGGAPGEGSDYAYHVLIRNSDWNPQMIADLTQVDGLDNINLTMQEQLLEV